MKFFILAAALFVVVKAGYDVEFKEKAMKKIHEAGAACAEEEKATGEDIGELLEKKMPSRKEGKCLLACFNQKFGAQDKDGKISKEGAMKAIEPFKADPEIYDKIKKVTEKCLNEVKDTGDRCETALALAKCNKKESEAVGLDESIIM